MYLLLNDGFPLTQWWFSIAIVEPSQGSGSLLRSKPSLVLIGPLPWSLRFIWQCQKTVLLVTWVWEVEIGRTCWILLVEELPSLKLTWMVGRRSQMDPEKWWALENMSPASNMASFFSTYVEFQGAGRYLKWTCCFFFRNACCFFVFVLSLPRLKMNICSFEVGKNLVRKFSEFILLCPGIRDTHHRESYVSSRQYHNLVLFFVWQSFWNLTPVLECQAAKPLLLSDGKER